MGTLIPGPKCGMRHATRVNESQRSRLWHYCGANLPASCAGAAAGVLWMWKSSQKWRSETEIAVQCGSYSRRVAVQNNDDGGRLQLRSRSRSRLDLDHNHYHYHNHGHGRGHSRGHGHGQSSRGDYTTTILLLCYYYTAATAAAATTIAAAAATATATTTCLDHNHN